MNNKHWQALIHHQQNFSQSLSDLFQEDEHRFQRFSLNACGILFDYSKQRVQENTLSLFCDLAQDLQFAKHRQALFSGEKINQSENQPALHSILRDLSKNSFWLEDRDVKQEVKSVLDKLEAFVSSLRHPSISSSPSSSSSSSHLDEKQQTKPIQDIICLGIGGSELGPLLLCEALKDYQTTHLNLHFVSNVDAKTLTNLLKRLDPTRSLCLISSKTFSTAETLENAEVVKAWLQNALQSAADAQKHLYAVTTKVSLAEAFGILPQNIFEFWPWVGGRYSVWSAVGLPAMLSIGMEHFKEFLAGAYEMDQHFQTAPLRENMPFIMAMLSVWNRNFWHYPSQAIIPYDDALAKLPSYIQQLEMESNGKSVNIEGERLSYPTAPIIWGGVGCNAQHAFMQLLHQGHDIIPVDFLISVEGKPELPGHQKLLLANCFAQSKALMEGHQIDQDESDESDRSIDNRDNINSTNNISNTVQDGLKKLKECPGNRPSSTLIYPKLTPRILGSLLALFEHKVFVQGVIWGINSFDQWGVELGKTLAKNIMQGLEDDADNANANANANNAKTMSWDSSTRGLLKFARSKY